MHFLGIDVGGTKVSVSLGTELGEVLHAKRVPTPSLGSFKEGVPRITALAREVLEEKGMALDQVDAIGVGVPGAVNVEKGLLVRPPNMVGWSNVPLADTIREELGRPVYLNNDANGWALAEYLFGSCKGLPNLIILTNSTGMGGGIIVNHQLVQGASDMAGEVGHMTINRDGPGSGGLTGTFEGFCGGLSNANQVRADIANGQETRILEFAENDPQKIDMREIREAIRAGDAYAVKLWDEYIERLAQGIGVLLMTLNPNAIILGTIAIHSGELLMDPLLKALPRYAWPRAIDACTIIPSALEKIGDLSALAIAITAHQK